MCKPVIGIVAKHKKSKTIRQDSFIRDEVKQAIYDNGGIAIGILSPNEEVLNTGDYWKKYESKIDKEKIFEQLKICDGIVLQSGTMNEAYENFIAQYCFEQDIPCLGICAGQNSIARGTGGTTFKIPNPEKHKKEEEYVHNVFISDTSKFYGIVQKKEIMVNSRHRRAIATCPMLEKVGFCDDYYADVIEAKDKRFYMGVRFHPESLYQKDENMNRIFISFIDACRKFKADKKKSFC